MNIAPTSQNLAERITSRKYMTMVVSELVWILMLVNGYLTESAFLSLTYMTIGLYFGANILEKSKLMQERQDAAG